ncbi:MAG: tyrosine-protein phosphatase [bacterium]
MESILTAQPNFRDLGSIPTTNGHSIRRGILFRSGDLSTLTEEDIRAVESVGLTSIIDFRAQREIDKRPDKVISTVREIVFLPIHDAAREIAERYFDANNAQGLETILVGDYRRLITDHVDEYRKFFKILSLTENLPLVFHCAAGKDRTGLASALLLFSLGVGWSEIWKDYLDSNHYTTPMMLKIIRKLKDKGKNGAILRPILEVREAYLNAALDQIDKSFGSIDHFLQKVLRVDYELLRRRYLVAEIG